MLRRVSIAVLLLSGACTRVPADVSTPGTASASTSAVSGEPASAKPIPSECKSAELTTCADSCSDSACLEWCAGESCVATIASLSQCMGEAERRFADEHPAPAMDYEEVTGPEGESWQQPTAESLDRQYDWESAHEGMLDERWADACLSICEGRVTPSDGEELSFCGEWRSSYYAWARLSEPPPDRSQAGILGMAAGMGMLGALSLGTTMWLDGELAQRYDDPHATALMQMVSRAGWQLREAESCVPDLDADGREFAIAVELDPNGAVVAAHARDDSSSTGECVAGVLASAFALPLRVARDYPQLDVRVLVRPVPDFGGLSDYGVGDLGDLGSVWDGDVGGLGTVGDGYGTMGTGDGGGTVYGGSGGGGGYGVGGGGAADIGSLDPAEPDDSDSN